MTFFIKHVKGRYHVVMFRIDYFSVIIIMINCLALFVSVCSRLTRTSDNILLTRTQGSTNLIYSNYDSLDQHVIIRIAVLS